MPHPTLTTTILLEDYLTCAICMDTFKEPLTLGCNHSFCSGCLHNCWDQNNTRNCPICRRKSSRENPVVNFALKELCLTFTEKREVQAGVCSSHPEVPALFCKDEARAVCPVCEFSLHSQHTVVPLAQARRDLQKELQTQLHALKKQRGEVQSLEQAYMDIQQHSEGQADVCERHIRAEFDRFHRFLEEEEELRLTTLREEQSRQSQAVGHELGRVRERLASLDQSIQELKTQLQRKTVDFVLSYKPVQRPTFQPLPQVGPGLLLNQAKLLSNLSFKVWKEMKRIVQFSPVVLDPNTAHPGLSLSNELASVRQADSRHQLPDNPERFNKHVFVLASEGFSTDTHLWDVEVGDHPHWIVGVAKESVGRKGDILPKPENGFWCLFFHNDKYFTVNKTLNIKRRPQMIRVQLDCLIGTVSFFDPSDMSLIHIYKETFTEKLYPIFSAGSTDAECRSKDIRVLPIFEST
uniref:Zinc-binding protein A33-like n=1 Tax=Neogobius melanostomus TaxID=47308 RepID=A0A8C6WZV3_9GOBI